MKTYHIYFLVYSFFGVILISAATLAHGIEPHHAHPSRHSINAHDVYEWGWNILGLFTFLTVIDCLRLALKENRRVLGLK